MDGHRSGRKPSVKPWGIACLMLLLAGGFGILGMSARAEAAARCPAAAADIRAVLELPVPPSMASPQAGPMIRVAASQHGDGEARSLPALLQRAEALQRRGHHRQAIEILDAALALAEARGDRYGIAAASGGLGSAYLAIGATGAARLALERSLEAARVAGLAGAEAATLINLGNLLAAEGSIAAALSAYDDSVQLALIANRPESAARAAINAARMLARGGDRKAAEEQMRIALDQLEQVRAAPDHGLMMVSIGLLLRDINAASGTPGQDGTLLAYRLFLQAAEMAAAAGDTRTESYALGYLGRLYQDEGRTDEALRLTRRALFLAQTGEAPEALYLWQWQTGRLLAAQGDVTAAVEAYRGAVRTLQVIRADLPAFDLETGESLFRKAVGPVFSELADLLLTKASEIKDSRAAQPYLAEARLTVEQLKTAELEDYFRDDCVAVLQSQITPIDRLEEHTAALYPILLPERTELLVSLPDGLTHIAIPVPGERLNEEAHALRRMLEKLTTREYLPHAQRLYDWLIRPLETRLAAAGIDTLVFVPDGALRTVPLAALHDGEQFLISRYAVATTPGLSLLDPRPIARADIRVLMGGLTEAVQGFAPLPHVAEELGALSELFGGTVLKDESFVAKEVERSLDTLQYEVVHIASHGRFAGEPEDSFVLTYDGRLDMDELEEMIQPSRFRKRPIELLTLSACRTAAGDDRAALGLAGVAIKAGARSALASLWYINDPASSLLVTEFYHRLRGGKISKAEALQQAQLTLLQDPRYRHPGYWSPFLILGNWL